MTTVEAAPPLRDRRLPPVGELTVVSLALMLAGGVDLATSLPRPASLAPVVSLLAAGAVLTIVAVGLLSRIRPFAWDRFFLVGRWAFAAYVIIAGILAFVFIFDHTRGSTLAVLLATLVVFAIDVPMAIAYTVARYQATA